MASDNRDSGARGEDLERETKGAGPTTAANIPPRKEGVLNSTSRRNEGQVDESESKTAQKYAREIEHAVLTVASPLPPESGFRSSATADAASTNMEYDAAKRAAASGEVRRGVRCT